MSSLGHISLRHLDPNTPFILLGLARELLPPVAVQLRKKIRRSPFDERNQEWRPGGGSVIRFVFRSPYLTANDQRGTTEPATPENTTMAMSPTMKLEMKEERRIKVKETFN